jgi:oligosaccharyltransferase complex subunit alpha (ribophorin I)
VKLTINTVILNQIQPYPKQIKMTENQKVVYQGNVYFYSPYKAILQKTQVILPTPQTDSFTQVNPTQKNNQGILYGSYSNVSPRSVEPLRVHYLNNNRFLTIERLRKDIEISHWGNLAIEEHYHVKHVGAELKGGFSRLDYQRNPMQVAPSHFRTLTAFLPKTATDIYFRDRIGNISSSDCRVSRDNKKLEVDFNQRFPLFGGWQNKFYVGYNLPIQHYLSKNGKTLTLETLFSTTFENAVVKNIKVRVILPEGAENIRSRLPFSVESEKRKIFKTYLDTTGRTVLIFEKKNIVDEHNLNFYVDYDFPSINLLREPLILIVSLFLFCIILMIYTRFNFSISKVNFSIKKKE